MMVVLKLAFAIIIMWFAVWFEGLAISAQVLSEDAFMKLEEKLNALQSFQSILNLVVLESRSDLDKEKKMRVTLEEKLALLEASQLQLQMSLTQETEKRTLIEARFHSFQNGISYEKQRRTLLDDQLTQLKRVFKDHHDTLQKAVENVSLSCCAPSSHKIKVHGDWSAWGSWGDCTRTCGDGQRKRHRTCTNPTPTNGGRQCVAHSQDTDHCNNAACLPPVLRHASVIIGGGYGRGVNQFNRPRDVAVSPAGGRFYVADSGNDRVKIYNDDGAFVKTFGTEGRGDGQFDYPIGLAVNSHEEVIITDRWNNRIVVCDRDGQFKYTFGTRGSNKGQFKYPWGVAVDMSDNIYICDISNHRVQVFSRTGEFIRQFGREGSAPGELSYPYYVSVAMTTGRVYVTDHGNNRVSVFTAEGEFIFTFGTYGEANGEMSHPAGIVIDQHGFVILCDDDNNRIQVFNADGRLISTFGSKGVNNGQFNSPHGLAIMQNGDVIVADWGNNRVQIVSK